MNFSNGLDGNRPKGEKGHNMENKKGLFSGIHRDGYTWKDSMIVSILVFFMMIISGSGIGMLIGKIIKLFSNEGNAEFLEILGDNFAFLGYWIIAFIYLLLVKSDKPILRAFGREPRGNTVKMALWGLLIGLCLNALCVGIAVFHGDIQLSFSSFPVLKLLIVLLSVFAQSGEAPACLLVGVCAVRRRGTPLPRRAVPAAQKGVQESVGRHFGKSHRLCAHA